MKWDPNRSEWRRPSEEGPPDLESLIKSFFGSQGSVKKQPPSSEKKETRGSLKIFFAIFFAITIFWLFSGCYVVKESERAVILRFGKYHDEVGSGLHWRMRGIDQIFLIDMRAISSLRKESTMLTADENLVFAVFEFQFHRNNPREFLFGDASPLLTLQQLCESCIRDVVGHSTLDEILTTGKQSITKKIHELIQQSLLTYHIGIEVLDVNLLAALPPAPVQAAFNDVIRAREDRQAYQNEALRYRESQLPIAQSSAKRTLLNATAYREEQLLLAQSKITALKLLVDQGEKNPEILRSRLYFDAIQAGWKYPRKIVVSNQLTTPIVLTEDLRSNAYLSSSMTGSKGSRLDEENK